MGRVLTNNVSLAYGVQSAEGTDATAWKLLEPNTIGKLGSNVTTVARNPISKNRQRQKGTITDLDSGVEFEHDFTLEAFIDFIEGFMFARQARGAYDLMSYSPTAVTSGGSGGYTVAPPTSVTVVAASTANVTIATGLENGDAIDSVTLATGNLVLLKNQSAPAENGLYTVVSSGAASRAAAYDSAAEIAGVRVLVAGGSTNIGRLYELSETDANNITLGTTSLSFTLVSNIAANTLLFARGFSTSANNGLKVAASGSTATNIRVDSLTAEVPTATQNATLEIAGVQASVGDLDVDSSGRITSSTLDFTTLGLTVGQMIHVGGQAAGTRFTTAANYGFARITAIAANLLTLDKKSQAFVTEANTTSTVQLLWGRFIRNLAADNARYLTRFFQFELATPGLGSAGQTAYEYPKDNLCNEVSFSLPLTNKASMQLGFMGKDTIVPTTTRKSGASSPLVPVQRDAFNTTPDVARLRVQAVDETGISTDFKELTLTINNNVSPEKVIGTLGAAYMNVGTFDVSIEATLLYTSADVVSAIRANSTVGLDFVLRGDDGAVGVDIPSLTLSSGDKSFPLNESVTISTPGNAHEHPTLGTSLAVTVFPFVPTA